MAEWNDRFRDYVRSYWLEWGSGKTGERHHPTAPELATRIAGSSDMFGHSDPYGMRGPVASVNFITAHDGFTARDLVTYTNKHNEANGENNRDGTDNNRSFNHGVEGETDDAGVQRARRRSLRNLLGTLLLSAGTPMLLGGDEIGRTQRGSNNAYCQDNDINWVNWELEPWQLDLKASVARLIELRKAHRVLRPSRFYDGVDDDPRDQLYRADSAWFQANGEHEDDDWWEDPKTRVVQFMRSLSDVSEADALVIINGSREAAQVTIPNDEGAPWQLVWDSALETPDEIPAGDIAPGAVQELRPMTIQLYISHPPEDARATNKGRWIQPTGSSTKPSMNPQSSAPRVPSTLTVSVPSDPTTTPSITPWYHACQPLSWRGAVHDPSDPAALSAIAAPAGIHVRAVYRNAHVVRARLEPGDRLGCGERVVLVAPEVEDSLVHRGRHVVVDDGKGRGVGLKCPHREVVVLETRVQQFVDWPDGDGCGDLGAVAPPGCRSPVGCPRRSCRRRRRATSPATSALVPSL